MPYSFCPKCGHALTVREVDHTERLVCSNCEFVFYQNSKPCSGALTVDGNKVLLVQRAIEPFKDWWDIPGGFLEAGEHPEAGAIREMKEETGLDVKIVDTLGVYIDNYGQSDDHTLNFCYVAQVVSGEAQPGSDAGELKWFDVAALPEKIAFGWSKEALVLLQAWIKSHQISSGDSPALAKPSLFVGISDQKGGAPDKPVGGGGLFGGQLAAEKKSVQKDAAPVIKGTLHRAISERVSGSLDTIYVNALHQGEETGSKEQPFRTISKALERAIAKNTIIVAPGIYHENIRLKEKVRLVSQITGAAVIHGGADRFRGRPTIVGVNEAELIGFTIMGGYIGVLCRGTSPLIRHNIIRDNFGDYGLACLDQSRAIIQNNTILANLGSDVNGLSIGLYVQNAEPFLYNNIITGNNIGYESDHAHPTERYNNFWGNRRNFGHSTKPNRRSILVDPKFVNPSLGDFQLQPDSPCRQAGRDPESKGLVNIGAYDANSKDVVEIAWAKLPEEVKAVYKTFPFVEHIQRRHGESGNWVSALDEQTGQYWAMPDDEILLAGYRLVAGRHANSWFAMQSGDLGLPVVYFGNTHHLVEVDEHMMASTRSKKAESMQELVAKVPPTAVSGWVFIKIQGLESNPVYLEIRRL